MIAIAIVEDNADNRLLLRALLEPSYELTEYETGTAALAGLPEAMPDLVLLDISLPGMDGLEVLARIRSNVSLRHLPVIAFTAHAMAGDREKYLAAGFDDYVTRPIVDETLLFDAITPSPRCRHAHGRLVGSHAAAGWNGDRLHTSDADQILSDESRAHHCNRRHARSVRLRGALAVGATRGPCDH
jgi:two-component system, cell cycle response regulator DivK